MTCPRSVLSQRHSKLDAETKWALVTVVLPVIAGPPQSGTPIDTSSNTPVTDCNRISTDTDLLVDTYLKTVYEHTSMASAEPFSRRCMSLGRHLGTPELFPYFKAAVQAAMEKTEAVARQSHEPLDPLKAVAILVSCLNHEFEKANLVPQLMDAVEAAWSDEGSTSSPRGWVWDVMGRAVSAMGSTVKSMVPTILLSGLLSALPLASGAPIEGTTETGDEVTEIDSLGTSPSAEGLFERFYNALAEEPFLVAGGVMFDIAFFYAMVKCLRNGFCVRSTTQSRAEQAPTKSEWVPLNRRDCPSPSGGEETGPRTESPPPESHTNGPDQFIFLDNLLVARWGTRWYPLPDGFEWDKTDDVIKSKALMLKDGRPVVSDGEVTEVPYTVYEHTATSSDGTCPLWTKIPEGYHKAEQLRLTSDGQALLKFEDVWYKVDVPIHHDGNNVFEGPCFYKDDQGHVVVEGFARYEVPLETKAEPYVHQASGSTLSDTVSVTSSVDFEEYQVTWSALCESTEALNSLLGNVGSLSPGQSEENLERDQISVLPAVSANTQTKPDNVSGDPKLVEVIIAALRVMRDDLNTTVMQEREVFKDKGNVPAHSAVNKLQKVDEIIKAVASSQQPSLGPRRWDLTSILGDSEMSEMINSALHNWEAKLATARVKAKEASQT